MALIKNNSHCGVKYLDRFAELVCHVADDPEDDEAGEHAGDAVADGDNDCVPEHVVVEVVVAGQGDHHAPRDANREENLCARRSPNLLRKSS